MNAGQIEQFASPQDVYEKPANAFVFKFLGNYNLFHARADSPQQGALVRPHEIALYRDAESAGPEGQPGVVSHIGFGGPVVKVEIERDDKNSCRCRSACRDFPRSRLEARRPGLVAGVPIDFRRYA